MKELHEQISVTPSLDQILSELPPPTGRQYEGMLLVQTEAALKRLLAKSKRGTLSQKDIERELRALPQLGGMENAKKVMIDRIRHNISQEYDRDIRKLPIE